MLKRIFTVIVLVTISQLVSSGTFLNEDNDQFEFSNQKNLIFELLSQIHNAKQKLANVSQPCLNKTIQFIQALKDSELWALTSEFIHLKRRFSFEKDLETLGLFQSPRRLGQTQLWYFKWCFQLGWWVRPMFRYFKIIKLRVEVTILCNSKRPI